MQEITALAKRFHWLVCGVRAARGVRQGAIDAYGCLIRSKAIATYLKTHQVSKLQIGAGPNLLPGWCNTDLHPCRLGVVRLNASKRFPLESNSFDYIFSEHQIEHMTYSQGIRMLRECFRVLKPGGTLRISTPDLGAIIGLFATELTTIQRRYIAWIQNAYFPGDGEGSAVFTINNAFRNWGHQFLYDLPTLRRVLEISGFGSTTVCLPGESANPSLRNIESHGQTIGDEELSRFETIVVEAVKIAP